MDSQQVKMSQIVGISDERQSDPDKWFGIGPKVNH